MAPVAGGLSMCNVVVIHVELRLNHRRERGARYEAEKDGGDRDFV